MERRVLIAIFLSFLVLYAYQALVVKPVPKPVTGGAGSQTASGESRSGTAATAPESGSLPGTGGTATPGSPAAPPRTPGTPPEAPAATALVGDSSERDVRVETRDLIAVFTNRGARLKSWRLKHFFDSDKQPLELVAVDLAGTHPLPFSLRASDDPDHRITATLNGGLYTVSGAPVGNAAESSATDLRFEYSDTAGIHAIKEFHLDPASYVVGFRSSVTAGDRAVAPAVQWGPALGDITSETSRYVKKAEGLTCADGKVQRLDPKAIAKQPQYDGTFSYAGVDDHYFMTVALFPGASKITYQPVSIPPPANSKEEARDLVAYSIETARVDAPQRFFFGPKDFDVLASIDRELVRAIDYGMFSFLVVPLLRSLKWVNSFVGNFGWSIVILTIIINAIMFPLRHKSVVSMRKMQEIQPEVKAIQDRYAKLKATDPGKQKMNQELMSLYKERGVNPASGCVPMLLTMPVLFAFWSLLTYSIELRGAPFFGWIHDLSLHDPLYIFPVLMGASQLWQQKMTPTPAGSDPAQQKMMLMMPVMFTFFFLWAPAGLALYYFISNLWGIGQQYLTNYMIGPPNIRTVRPAAERRMKRVGGGKTEAAAGES
jgi:YidC/Oxa1 family membrane protein insertase